jgi:cob(I)alamin adenosyltransferase
MSEETGREIARQSEEVARQSDEVARQSDEVVQRASGERAAAPPKRKGLVVVNTGDGKGKTTAALGLAFRALGHRMRVVVIQFIKGQWTPGEVKAARRLAPELEIQALGDGFTWVTKNPEQDRATTREIWSLAVEKILSGTYDLVILDEVNIAMKHGHLAPDEVIAVLRQRGSLVHVVLTGRGAPPEIVEFADLVSEIRAVKHPFRQGVRAQKGIEF